MSDAEIILEERAPIELRLLAAAIRSTAELARPSAMDERGDGVAALRLRTHHGEDVLVTSEAGCFVLHRGEERETIPWFLPIALTADSIGRGENHRLGIAGGPDERRLRMSWRTIHELRARSAGIIAVLLGDPTGDLPPEGLPDEIHGQLDPPEYLAALRSLDLVLECTDRFGSESFLAVAARDAGVPVVTHADRLDLAGSEHRTSSLWSADGFAEAVQHLRPGRAKTPARSSVEAVRQLVQRISGE